MKIEKNWLEWTVFAASLVIVLAFVGYLAYLIVVSGDQPADVVVVLGEPRRSSSGFTVPVLVHNRGDRTAEEVKVVITLETSGEPAEERELSFAFLPRRSEREGVVVFKHDPHRGRLSGMAASYESP